MTVSYHPRHPAAAAALSFLFPGLGQAYAGQRRLALLLAGPIVLLILATLLIALLFGLMVRVSASFGVLLMLIYWMAHMDWPFVENKNNLLFDYHLIYGGVLLYLIVKRAGHVFGLDGWIEQTPFLARHPVLRPLTS